MKNAVYPQCPLNDCPGHANTKRSQRGNQYRQCDTCGEFLESRLLTDAERAKAKAAKAKKAQRKTQAHKLAERKAEQARLNALPQLPVAGWTPADWFPELAEKQLRMEI